MTASSETVETTASGDQVSITYQTGIARWLRMLEVASVAYLLLPVLIFVVGYLRPQFGYPLGFLLLLAMVLSLKESWAEHTEESISFGHRPWVTMAAVMLLTFFLVACTGIGAFTYQFFDYVGTDALLRDYMQYDLPLAFQSGPDDKPYYLVMYAGYWLPAAMAGKLLGWYGAYYAHYLWAALGLFLIVCWYMRLAGAVRFSLALLLLFFGGMDVVGRLFSEGGAGSAGVSWWDWLTGVFWWGEGRGWLDHWSSGFALTDPDYAPKAGGVFFRFYSPLSYMVDGPQHIVPPLLGFMVILHDLWHRKNSGRVLFLWSLLPLCSVFTAAGSLPFIVLGMAENRCRNLLTLANTVALPVLLVVFSYFGSTQSVGGGVLVSGWLWLFQDLRDTWWMLLLHYAAEFVLLSVALLLLWQRERMPSIFWFLGCMGFFFLAPFYRMGTYNDFSSKVIIPAQFVFITLLAVGMLYANTPIQRLARAAMLVLLCIGAIAPVGVVMRALDFGMFNLPPELSAVRHLNQWEPRRLLMQGKGDKESLFWKYLAKEPVLRPTEPIFRTREWNFQELKEPINYWIFFTDPSSYTLSARGLSIKTKGNKPFLRRDSMELPADKVGQILIDAEVLVDGEAAKDAAIIAIWATDEQVKSAESDWPFQRWHSNQAWPVRSIVRANSYWRGNIASLGLYLRVPQGDERDYEVRLRSVAFLER